MGNQVEMLSFVSSTGVVLSLTWGEVSGRPCRFAPAPRRKPLKGFWVASATSDDLMSRVDEETNYGWKLVAAGVGLATVSSIDSPILTSLRFLGWTLSASWLLSVILARRALEGMSIEIGELRTRSSLNTALIAPQGFTPCVPGPSEISPIFPSLTVKELERRFLSMVLKEPRITRAHQVPFSHRYTFVQRSLVMQYPDVVFVEFVPLEDGKSSTIAIYSTSLVGQGDLGVNLKRIKSWLQKLQESP
mmetsp:Transcript_14402/g.29467  ORF Transcript_14402/g.29467 Transcript_14402/m.29467 type:complete len:247 (-) Transcript_14402:351-1091(-)